MWVRDRLRLPVAVETCLLAAIDGVFTRHERLWQESKQEAIQLAKDFLQVAGEGECELRQVYEPGGELNCGPQAEREVASRV